MVLDDFFDDGEPQPHALRAGGHVRLQHFLGLPGGKAGAVVFDRNRYSALFAGQPHGDVAFFSRRLGHPRLDGLRCIFQLRKGHKPVIERGLGIFENRGKFFKMGSTKKEIHILQGVDASVINA